MKIHFPRKNNIEENSAVNNEKKDEKKWKKTEKKGKGKNLAMDYNSRKITQAINGDPKKLWIKETTRTKETESSTRIWITVKC